MVTGEGWQIGEAGTRMDFFGTEKNTLNKAYLMSLQKISANVAGVGFGDFTVKPILSEMHISIDTTATVLTGIKIEQAGTGDSKLEFLLTGVQQYDFGIDNSDSDTLKLSRGDRVSTDTMMQWDTSGKIYLLNNTRVGDTQTPLAQFECGTGANFTEIDSTGKQVYKGTAGIPNGGIYVKDSGATVSVDSDIADVLVTQWTTNTDATNSTPDAANNKITITKVGHYLVSFSTASRISAGVAVRLYFNGYLGGNIQDNLHAHRSISSVDTGSLSFCSIIDVTTVPVDLDVRANIDSSTARDLVVEDAQLTILQVSGT